MAENLKQYIDTIKFKEIQPYNSNPELPNDIRTLIEVLNTELPDNKEMAQKLRPLLDFPRMSTFAIGAIINKAVSIMPQSQTFVNIGVWQGFTFLCGILNNDAKKCVGVDNFSGFGGPREQFLQRFNIYKSEHHTFYDMDFKNYFSQIHNEKIGVYVYDADHSYEGQFQGLALAEKYFAPNCIIIIDDTNRPHVRQSTIDFIHQSPHKYDIILDQTTGDGSDCSHITFWNGIIILCFRDE